MPATSRRSPTRSDQAAPSRPWRRSRRHRDLRRRELARRASIGTDLRLSRRRVDWTIALGRAVPRDRRSAAAAPPCIIGETVRTKLFGATDPLGQALRRQGLELQGDRRARAKKGTSGFGPDQDNAVLMPLRTVSAPHDRQPRHRHHPTSRPPTASRPPRCRPISRGSCASDAAHRARQRATISSPRHDADRRCDDQRRRRTPDRPAGRAWRGSACSSAASAS